MEQFSFEQIKEKVKTLKEQNPLLGRLIKVITEEDLKTRKKKLCKNAQLFLENTIVIAYVPALELKTMRDMSRFLCDEHYMIDRNQKEVKIIAFFKNGFSVDMRSEEFQSLLWSGLSEESFAPAGLENLLDTWHGHYLWKGAYVERFFRELEQKFQCKITEIREFVQQMLDNGIFPAKPQ